MSINIIYEKKYANGLVDYTDAEGNIIDYEPDYTFEEQHLIDTTPEERAQDALDLIAYRARVAEQRAKDRKMFLLTRYADIEKPKIRQPLWHTYWAERELCLLAGDTGVGKTALALEVARHLAGGRVLGHPDNEGKPRKVLYVDFELDNEGFYARCAEDENLENLYWLGYNRGGKMPNNVTDACEWMLDTIEDYLDETKAEVLIIDQPDRLHITPQRWRDLLARLKGFIVNQGISVMLVVNTKPRNYNRPLEMNHIYNYRLLCPIADSVVAVGANYNDWHTRYIKAFKTRNRALKRSEYPEGFMMAEMENTDEFKLEIFPTAPCPEEDLLKPTKAVIRERKIVSAEAMRKDGFTAGHIADELGVPEGTIKRWIRGIKPLPLAPLETRSPAWGEEEYEEEEPDKSPFN